MTSTVPAIANSLVQIGAPMNQERSSGQTSDGGNDWCSNASAERKGPVRGSTRAPEARAIRRPGTRRAEPATLFDRLRHVPARSSSPRRCRVPVLPRDAHPRVRARVLAGLVHVPEARPHPGVRRLISGEGLNHIQQRSEHAIVLLIGESLDRDDRVRRIAGRHGVPNGRAEGVESTGDPLARRLGCRPNSRRQPTDREIRRRPRSQRSGARAVPFVEKGPFVDKKHNVDEWTALVT